MSDNGTLTPDQQAEAQDLYASLRQDTGFLNAHPEAHDLLASLVKDGTLKDLSGGSSSTTPGTSSRQVGASGVGYRMRTPAASAATLTSNANAQANFNAGTDAPDPNDPFANGSRQAAQAVQRGSGSVSAPSASPTFSAPASYLGMANPFQMPVSSLLGNGSAGTPSSSAPSPIAGSDTDPNLIARLQIAARKPADPSLDTPRAAAARQQAQDRLNAIAAQQDMNQRLTGGNSAGMDMSAIRAADPSAPEYQFTRYGGLRGAGDWRKAGEGLLLQGATGLIPSGAGVLATNFAKELIARELAEGGLQFLEGAATKEAPSLLSAIGGGLGTEGAQQALGSVAAKAGRGLLLHGLPAAAGGIVSTGATEGQHALMNLLAPQATQQMDQAIQTAQTQQPVLSAAAQALSMRPYASVGELSLTSLPSRLASGAINMGLTAGQNAATGQPIKMSDLATAAATGALYGGETPLGEAVAEAGAKPVSRIATATAKTVAEQAAEKAGNAAATRRNLPPPVVPHVAEAAPTPIEASALPSETPAVPSPYDVSGEAGNAAVPIVPPVAPEAAPVVQSEQGQPNSTSEPIEGGRESTGRTVAAVTRAAHVLGATPGQPEPGGAGVAGASDSARVEPQQTERPPAESGTPVTGADTATSTPKGLTGQTSTVRIQNAQDFSNALQQHFGYDKPTADATAAIAEARAQTHAAYTGETPEQYFASRLAGVTEGKAPKAEPAPATPPAYAIAGKAADDLTYNYYPPDGGKAFTEDANRAEAQLRAAGADTTNLRAAIDALPEDPERNIGSPTPEKRNQAAQYDIARQRVIDEVRGTARAKLTGQPAASKADWYNEVAAYGNPDETPTVQHNVNTIDDAETGKPFTLTGFRQNRGGGVGVGGTGTFYATDPLTAGGYESGTWENFLQHGREGGSKQSLEVSAIDAKNPFVVDGTQSGLLSALDEHGINLSDSERKQLQSAYNVVRKGRQSNAEGETGYTLFDKVANNILAKRGYDALLYRKGDGSEVVRLQEPSTPYALNQQNKAQVQFLNDNRAVLRALQSPDASSGIHELGHIFRRDLYDNVGNNGFTHADLAHVEGWAGVKEPGVWDRAAEERFSRGFENYLQDGQAPTTALGKVFGYLKDAIGRVYAAVRGTKQDPTNVPISPEVRDVFDRLLGKGVESENGNTGAETSPQASGVQPSTQSIPAAGAGVGEVESTQTGTSAGAPGSESEGVTGASGEISPSAVSIAGAKPSPERAGSIGTGTLATDDATRKEIVADAQAAGLNNKTPQNLEALRQSARVQGLGVENLRGQATGRPVPSWQGTEAEYGPRIKELLLATKQAEKTAQETYKANPTPENKAARDQATADRTLALEHASAFSGAAGLTLRALGIKAEPYLGEAAGRSADEILQPGAKTSTAKPAVKSPAYGKNNRYSVSAGDRTALIADIKAKLAAGEKPQNEPVPTTESEAANVLNQSATPLHHSLAQLAAFHIEAGNPVFKDVKAAMTSDLGAQNVSHLTDADWQTAYLNARKFIADKVVHAGGVRPSSDVFANKLASDSRLGLQGATTFVNRLAQTSQKAGGAGHELLEKVMAGKALTSTEQKDVNAAFGEAYRPRYEASMAAQSARVKPTDVEVAQRKILTDAARETRRQVAEDKRSSLMPKEYVKDLILQSAPKDPKTGEVNKDFIAKLNDALDAVKDGDSRSLAEVIGRFAKKSLSYYMGGIIRGNLLSNPQAFGHIGLSHTLATTADNILGRPIATAYARLNFGRDQTAVQGLRPIEDVRAIGKGLRQTIVPTKLGGGGEVYQTLFGKGGETALQLEGHAPNTNPLGNPEGGVHGEFTPFPMRNTTAQAAANALPRAPFRMHAAFYSVPNAILRERLFAEEANLQGKREVMEERPDLHGRALDLAAAARAKDIALNPSADMLLRVDNRLREQMFSNRSALAAAVPGAVQASRTQAAKNKAAGGLGDYAGDAAQAAVHAHLPFGTVPTNVSARGVEQVIGAPMAMILRRRLVNAESLTPDQQRTLSMMFARGVYGPAMAGIGAVLASRGMLATADERKHEREGLVVNGKKVLDTSNIAPAGTSFNQGAALYDLVSHQASGTPLRYKGRGASSTPVYPGAADYLRVAGMPLLENPILRSSEATSSLFDMLSGKQEANPQKVAGGYLKMLVPGSAAASYAAAALDPTGKVRQKSGVLDYGKDVLPWDSLLGVPGRWSLPTSNYPEQRKSEAAQDLINTIKNSVKK